MRPKAVREDADQTPRTRCYREGVLTDEDFPLEEVSEHLAEESSLVWVDLCAPDQEALQLVMSEASSRHTAIKLDIPSAVARIIADGVLVRQALLNILMNALESTSASDSPGGPISVGMHSDEGAGIVEVVITYFGPKDERVGASERALALARAIAEVH